MAGLGGSVAGAAFGGPPRPVEQTNYAQGSLLHPGLQTLIGQLAAMRARPTFSGPPRPVESTNYAQAGNLFARLAALRAFNATGNIGGVPQRLGNIVNVNGVDLDEIPTPFVAPPGIRSEYPPPLIPGAGDGYVFPYPRNGSVRPRLA